MCEWKRERERRKKNKSDNEHTRKRKIDIQSNTSLRLQGFAQYEKILAINLTKIIRFYH